MTSPSTKTALEALDASLVTSCPFCGQKILTSLGAFVASDADDPRAAILCGLKSACSCETAKYTAEQEKAAEAAKECEKQKQQEKRRLANRWEAAGMPEEWHDRRLSAWHQDSPDRVGAYDAAVVFGSMVLGNKEPRSLFVAGDIGTGKTFLTSCLCADLLRKGQRLLWRNVSDVLREIRASYDNRKVSEEEVLNRFIDPPLLVLDDLGKERPTEWAMEQLFSIINARYDRNRPMVITTNYGGADLVKRLTPRPDASGYADDTTARAIVDRLRGSSKLIRLEGQSRRTN